MGKPRPREVALEEGIPPGGGWGAGKRETKMPDVYLKRKVEVDAPAIARDRQPSPLFPEFLIPPIPGKIKG